MIKNPDWMNAVMIPVAQSAITGGLTGLVAGSAAALARVDHPSIIGAGTAGLVTLAAWLRYRADWNRRLNALSGIVDELQVANAEAATIRLEIVSDQGRAGDYLFLPGGRERLVSFAASIKNGASITVREWVGKDKPFSPGEFVDLRNEFLSRGYAQWISPHDHRSGIALTHAGKAVIRYLAELDPTPLPPTVLPALSGLSIVRI